MPTFNSRITAHLVVCAIGFSAVSTAPLAVAAPARAKAARKKTTRKATAKKPAGPTSPEARRALAIDYVKQAAAAYASGDYKRTIRLCEIAADWSPTYPRAHVWMGAAYQKLGKLFEARMAYRWARALAPGTADAQRADRGLKEIGEY